MSKRFTYYSADVTDVFLLDVYPNAKAAYSLRKLSSTYTGSCIRVRRSSDNTEQDIGFVSNELDTTALLSFVGANNGHVTTWYNQKGTGDNLNNITAINHPLIVNSGVVETVNGKPAILGDSNDLLAAGNTTTFKYLHDGTKGINCFGNADRRKCHINAFLLAYYIGVNKQHRRKQFYV